MRWEKGKGREIPAETMLLELVQEVQQEGDMHSSFRWRI